MTRRGFLLSAGSLPLLQTVSEKPALLRALTNLRSDLRKLEPLLSAETKPHYTGSLQSLSWFESNAQEWRPVTPVDGRGLRESFERMGAAVRKVRDQASRLPEFLIALDDDLKDKVTYCEAQGLGGRRRVSVVTKRDAVAEVKGFEVLYLEKFLASDSAAKPQQFPGFSSPAVNDLVPGRYLFWAKEPGPAGRTGEHKEARVSTGSPAGPVEVLAP
jgi:hypothetical protein